MLTFSSNPHPHPFLGNYLKSLEAKEGVKQKNSRSAIQERVNSMLGAASRSSELPEAGEPHRLSMRLKGPGEASAKIKRGILAIASMTEMVKRTRV